MRPLPSRLALLVLAAILTASCSSRAAVDPVPTVLGVGYGDAGQILAALVSAGAVVVAVRQLRAQVRAADESRADADAARAEATRSHEVATKALERSTAAVQALAAMAQHVEALASATAGSVAQTTRLADAAAEKSRAELLAAMTTVAGACGGVVERLRAAVVREVAWSPGCRLSLPHEKWVSLVRDLPQELRTSAAVLAGVQESAAILDDLAVRDLAAARVRLEGAAARLASLDRVADRPQDPEVQATSDAASRAIEDAASRVANVCSTALGRLTTIETERLHRASAARPAA